MNELYFGRSGWWGLNWKALCLDDGPFWFFGWWIWGHPFDLWVKIVDQQQSGSRKHLCGLDFGWSSLHLSSIGADMAFVMNKHIAGCVVMRVGRRGKVSWEVMEWCLRLRAVGSRVEWSLRRELSVSAYLYATQWLEWFGIYIWMKE